MEETQRHFYVTSYKKNTNMAEENFMILQWLAES